MEFRTEKNGRKCESNIPIKLNTVEYYKNIKVKNRNFDKINFEALSSMMDNF